MKGLRALRLQLDDAITYGDSERAWALALEGLQRAEVLPDAGERAYFKGQLKLLAEDFHGAIECFDEAIRCNPLDGASFNDRALCMVEYGLFDEALVYVDRGITAEPDFATIHHNKGWLLNNMGRHSEAIGCFRKALELEPIRAVTYENLADAFANSLQWNLALESYQKALDVLKPEYTSIRSQIEQAIVRVEQKLKDQRAQQQPLG
jgi:tetratricopeptide (TPR) repeat protein